MAHELEAGTGDPVDNAAASAAALLLAGGPRGSPLVLLRPNYVDLEHVPRRDDEVGNGANPAPPLPLLPLRRLEFVAGQGRDLGGRRRRGGGGGGGGGGVGEEPGGAVLDPRGPMHHLEGRVAHCGRGFDLGLILARAHQPLGFKRFQGG